MRRFAFSPLALSATTRRFAATAAAAAGRRWWSAGAVFGGAAAFAAVALCAPSPKEMPKGHVARPDLPTYSIKEIKKHTNAKDGLWVTYKGGVYDVTSFIVGHPGGAGRLLMSGGSDLAIFWHVYRQHYQAHVLNFLEKYRIGNTTAEDAFKLETEFEFHDPFENDPHRPNPEFLHTTEKPFCGEAILQRIGESFYTPNDLHYVRLHMPVPEIAPEDWKVEIKGNGIPKPVTLTLKDIQKFQHHELACTLQCAGNRREDFQDLGGNKVFIAPQWRNAAFSNAKYKGVYLRDVLKSVGFDVDKAHYAEFADPKTANVLFDGTDVTEDGVTYGISIPIQKAVNPRGDVMFVWEMNGEPLPPDHGAPVRMLTPGHVGNKSCKFVESITIQEKEAVKPWHSKAYRNFPPDISFEEHLCKWDKLTEDQLKKGQICQMMPVQSLTTFPPPNAIVGAKGGMDSIYMRGVSWTGNGVGMCRVDVSANGGKNWTAADFLPKPADVVKREAHNRTWSWYLWERNTPLSEEVKEKLKSGNKVTIELVSKGVDNMFNVQPDKVLPYYNARGVVVNHQYRVPVVLDPKLEKGRVIVCKGEDHFNPPTGGHFRRNWYKHGWSSPEAMWHEQIVAESKMK